MLQGSEGITIIAEIRIAAEGTLRFVQASGSGQTWATATSPASGIIGYVRSFSYDSGQTITTVSDRGIPNHHKVSEKKPITVTFDFATTGSELSYATSNGATVPLVHLELRASAAELGAASGFYHQFYGGALQSKKLSEAKEENKISLSFVALAMNGPTASGYLS